MLFIQEKKDWKYLNNKIVLKWCFLFKEKSNIKNIIIKIEEWKPVFIFLTHLDQLVDDDFPSFTHSTLIC